MSHDHRPRFTDQEVMTVYLFGHRQGHFTQRRIYDYTAGHWRAYFPDLPGHQAFNRRLDRLSAAFALALQDALAQSATRLGGAPDRLLDSLPVLPAGGARRRGQSRQRSRGEGLLRQQKALPSRRQAAPRGAPTLPTSARP